MVFFLLACQPDGAPVPPATEPDRTVALPSQCENPAESLVYADVPGLLDTTDSEQPFMEQGAAAMADLDGDGDDDLLISKRSSGVYLQENGGGALKAPVLILPDPRVSTIALADVDADGDLDVFIGGHADTPTLLRNDGPGTFTIADAGMPWVQSTIRGAAFGDTDGDGDLDLMLAVAGEGPDMVDRLLLNDGTGRFVDATKSLPVPSDGQGLSWDPVLSDLDRDGDTDLYLVNAEQQTNGSSRLLRNEGGTFVEETASCNCGITGSPMGASVADLDGDLLPDLYLAGTSSNLLLLAEPALQFVDGTAAFQAGAFSSPGWMAYGALIFDHDNDGWSDILIATGPLGDARFQQPDQLLVGGPDGFRDEAPALGLADLGIGRAVVGGFLDADGFLDPLVTHLGSPSHLYEAPCTGNRSLTVDLKGRAPNSFGQGAWVEVDTTEQTFLREVSSHAGWGSAIHPRAHFGLGRSYPTRLRVYWPSGAVSEQELGPDTAMRLTIEE